MSITRRFSVSILFLVLATSALSAQTAPGRSNQEQAAKPNIIIERQLVRFTNQGEALEWRLVVTNQQGELVFESGFVYGNALEWPLLNQQGQAIASGLYTYTLTTKAATDETPRTQRGHLIVDRASNLDRVWATSSQPTALGATSESTKLTIIGSAETTLGGAEFPGEVPGREASTERSAVQRDAQGRALAEQAEPAQKNSAGGLGPSVKTNIPDDLTVGGNIFMADTGLNNPRDIRTSNNNAGLRFTATNGPLTATPNGAAIQFWGNNSFFTGQLYLDAGAHNNGALIFRTAPTGGTIAERLRVTATGNVGIGTMNPARPLEIANGKLRFSNDLGDIEFTEVADLIAHATTASPVASDPAFRVDTGANLTRVFTVLNSGRVGIGAPNPTAAKLEVQGDNNVAVYARSFGGIGVYGLSYATEGTGVLGAAFATSGGNRGVSGYSDSSNGHAGFFL